MRSHLLTLLLIPILQSCTFQLSDLLTEWQATAEAAGDCHPVEAGGDLMTNADLAALSHLALGNSAAAITARFGLPTAYSGSTVYYPVDPAQNLWVTLDLTDSKLNSWNYSHAPLCGG
jgi:hypothetical protein